MSRILIIALIASVLSIPVLGFITEKKAYNGGKCPNCGGKLKHFGTDSQGGRGYVCEKCSYCTWVSYGGIDKRR